MPKLAYERVFKMIRAKQISALIFIAAMLVFAALPVMAAELSIKENYTKSGSVNVAVPYISGSVGGQEVDFRVNQAVFSYVNSQMKKVLSKQEIEIFDSTHKDARELLRNNSDLAKYTKNIVMEKNNEGKLTASWFFHNEYEIKTAKNTFYSVILKIKTYTGGPHSITVWKAMNFDLKDGRLVELKDLFDAKADYAARLRTLIGYQQKGRARLIRHIKGKNVAEPQPVTITGQENFYVDDHYNLGIILNSEEPETDSQKMEIYDISLNDFADLIRL